MSSKDKPNKFIAFITNKWFIRAVGFIFLFCLIWFLGPALALAENYFLASVASRLILFFSLVAIFAGYQYYKFYMRKKNDSQFAEDLSLQSAKKDEANKISDRFSDAITLLLESSGKRKKDINSLNDLPWYIIIGPPGSGKTTALVNSGLEFPLKERLGADAVKGIGGTRHCDWWFTNEAVLIDTAGRFTTQDSDSEVDKTAWTSFISLLKKYRKQRPINGALVTMSLSDLITFSEDERVFYAKTIRKRIDELRKNLGISFPVYFIFTKCDLINGFNAFFDTLNAKQRNQVWGETFDIDSNGNCALDIANYHERYDALIERLNEQLILFLKEQNDPAKKADIFSFPAQLEALKEPIHKFLVDIFGENKFQTSALLRGVYFTSGTQQGAAFDSLLGDMAENMGFAENESVNYSGRGKSFFIRDLLSEVIFPEYQIAGVDIKFQRLTKRIRIASITLALIATLGMSFLWFLSFNENQDRIVAVDHSVATQAELIDQLRSTSPEFHEVLPVLDEARNLTQIFDNPTNLDYLGLNQKSNFDNQSLAIYLDTLETTLLPLVKTRLEEMIVDVIENGNPADLYALLKAYLMYAGQHLKADAPFEKEWLMTIASADWQQTYSSNKEIAQNLTSHLDYLLSQDFQKIQVNEDIASAASGTLLRLPLEEQIYIALSDYLQSDTTQDLSFTDIAGNDGMQVFATRDRSDISQMTIPYMFTKEGFYLKYTPTVNTKVDEYLKNTWILGESTNLSEIGSKEDLIEEVNRIYYREYISTWLQFVRNLEIANIANRQQGFSVLRTVGETSSPISKLVKTVASQTNLTEGSGEAGDQVKGVGEIASIVNSQAQRAVSTANRIGRATERANLITLPGAPVKEAFDDYHRVVSDERGDPRIDVINNSLSEYFGFIDQTILDSFSETPAFDAVLMRMSNPSRSEFSRLIPKSTSQPRELNRWLDEISAMGWSMVIQEAKNDIQSVWQQQVYPLYVSALEGRYPFEPSAQSEVELRDFADFFKPGGAYDNFVKRYIIPFVNTSTSNWQPKTFGGFSLNINPSALLDLQSASNVTKYFFPPNSATPNVTFSFMPISLEPTVAQFTMQIGAQELSYAHGPRRSTKVAWPLVANDESTRIEFTQLDGRIKQRVESGPWSLFRLLGTQQMTSTARSAIYHARITVEGSSIEYEIRADSEFNPLGNKVLQNLRLPDEL